MLLNENDYYLGLIQMNNSSNIREQLAAKGLKVTPQRMRVMEAIYKLNNHPTAEHIIEFVRKKDPNIGLGTVYKVLETLVEKELIKKVKTENGIMRYDGILRNHHHLYCATCDYIEDYENERLDEILKAFFRENQIDNFIIKDIHISINGDFINHKNKNH